MSKFLMIAGILLAALGLTTVLMVLFSFGQMQILGITPDFAITLIVGGLVTLGLGGVVDAIQKSTGTFGDIRERLARVELEAGVPPGRANLPVNAATAAATAAAAAAAAEAAASVRIPAPVPAAAESAGRVFESARSRTGEVAESLRSDTEKMIAEARQTSEALDRAKAEIEEALAPEEITIPPEAQMSHEYPVTEMESAQEPEIEPKPEPEPEIQVAEVEEPEPETVAEPEPEIEAGDEPAEDEQADDQLYVVEERMIRGRPARVLSDGTVEAETDEGWMRFENLDHLEEYLDAMSPGRA